MNERRIVAATSFEESAPPPGAPAALPETGEIYLRIELPDGTRNDALLVEPAGRDRTDVTLVVHGHGSGSDYLAAPNGELARGLAAHGFAALTFNNRAFGAGVNTENFFDVRRDFEAAVGVGRALGFRRIVLSGHSLGTLHALYFAATTWDAGVTAVVLNAPFSDLPWKTRAILVQNETSYARLGEQAREALRGGRDAEPLAERMGYYTGASVPVTPRHFLTYRDESVSAAHSTDWIARVPYPILITRGEADGVIAPWEPHALLARAHTAGSLVPAIAYVQIADSAPPSVPGHSFVGTEATLATAVSTWLRAQGA